MLYSNVIVWPTVTPNDQLFVVYNTPRLSISITELSVLALSLSRSILLVIEGHGEGDCTSPFTLHMP